jgi:hypothetical protein
LPAPEDVKRRAPLLPAATAMNRTKSGPWPNISSP